MGFDFASRSWRNRVGYRAGSEEVVDDAMDASSVYVASIFLSAYTGGSCSHMSGTQYALYFPSCELRPLRLGT
jgi:hypothetical protein